jgi:hypothetical protein
MKRWIIVIAALLICIIGLRHHSRQAVAQANGGQTSVADSKTLHN